MNQCALLHVEDDDASAFLFRLALDEAELQASVYRVSDGKQALDFLRKADPYQNAHTPVLIVLDLNMPRIDGWTVLAERQKDPVLRSIPAIVLSTACARHHQARAFALGAQQYLEKPLEFDSLVQQVRTYCGPFLDPALALHSTAGGSASSLQRIDVALRQQEHCSAAQSSH